MLHALLGTSGHPRVDFLDRCGGTVSCDQGCVAEAGPPPPDSSARVVAPSDIAVAVAVAPDPPIATSNDGFLTVTVLATNSTGGPVVVALPGRDASHFGQSYSYHLQSPSGGIGGGALAIDPGVLQFAPGETKRFVFDFRIAIPGIQSGLSPDTYSVGGAFGQHWAYGTSVLVP